MENNKDNNKNGVIWAIIIIGFSICATTGFIALPMVLFLGAIFIASL